jgi:predicted nucleotidyltransferase
VDIIALFEKFKLTLQYHNKLNPKIWNNGKLSDALRNKLIKKAYEFAKFSGVSKDRIKDIVFTGSNANYNYTQVSDVDVHIVTDISGLSEDTLYKKKVEWAEHHGSLKFGEYPIEFYIHNVKELLPLDQGVFSLTNNKWDAKPVHLGHIKALTDKRVIHKVQFYIRYIKDLIKGSGNDNTKKIKDLKTKFWKNRTAGLKREGEFSVENIIYKDLRNRGLIDKLNKKVHITDDDA